MQNQFPKEETGKFDLRFDTAWAVGPEGGCKGAADFFGFYNDFRSGGPGKISASMVSLKLKSDLL